jgi:hypothetical protein
MVKAAKGTVQTVLRYLVAILDDNNVSANRCQWYRKDTRNKPLQEI